MTLLSSLLSWATLHLSSPSPSRSSTTHLPPSSPIPLLLLRSLAGYLGIFSFYYSLRTLSLSTASVINFVAPILAVLLLSLLPNARISLAQLLAGAVSLAGVICVLQPWTAHAALTGGGGGGGGGEGGEGGGNEREYVLAVAAALVGVLGGALSFVAIAKLGDTVHPLRTVAWFSTTCAVLSSLSLVLQPDPVTLPSTTPQWVLVFVLGVLAFAMHWLMTASLAWDADSKRPLNFVYTQILFAMVADRAVWGVVPDAWKYVGGALIIGSALFVASTRERREYALVESRTDEEEYDPVDLDTGKERAESSIESKV